MKTQTKFLIAAASAAIVAVEMFAAQAVFAAEPVVQRLPTIVITAKRTEAPVRVVRVVRLEPIVIVAHRAAQGGDEFASTAMVAQRRASLN